MYSKPKDTGGKLIREVIGFCRSQGLKFPFNSHILIAASGGADSVALAHLLARYGRRVASPQNITLLHINHGWRGQESKEDERFVRKLAKELGVRFIARRLDPKKIQPGESWEEHARKARKRIFAQEAERLGAVVLTAHHADDLAETLLWRIFTGTARTHGGGILFQNEAEIRPFLRVRKRTLKQYLKEEGQVWREDRTNSEGRFLRSKMRAHLLPALEEIFPKAIQHLVELALDAQARGRVTEAGEAQAQPLEQLFDVAGLSLRKAHLDRLHEAWSAPADWTGELHLPQGWKIKRPTKKHWILEKG